MDRSLVADVARLVTVGSAVWVLHGISMLVGIAAFLLFFFNTSLQIVGSPSPGSSILDLIAAISFGAYAVALILVLVGSILFGLALLGAAKAVPGGSRARHAGAILFVHGALAGVAFGGLALRILADILADEGLLRASTLSLFGSWLVASVLLLVGVFLSRAPFSALRRSLPDSARERGTILAAYSIVNLVGAVPLALGLILASVANITLPGFLGFVGAVAGLIVAPILAIVAFALLRRRALELRRAAASA